MGSAEKKPDLLFGIKLLVPWKLAMIALNSKSSLPAAPYVDCPL
jgi:hypothetical protein